MGKIIVDQLRIFRIKGTRGEVVYEMDFDARGSRHDRRYMIIHADTGRFISQRTHPYLVRISTEPKPDGLTLKAPGQPFLKVPRVTSGPLRPVKVHSHPCHGIDQGDDAARWLTTVLDTPCRLVWQPKADRPVDPTFAPIGTFVSYADGFPILLMNTASVADFNRRLPDGHKVTMDHFRANIDLAGLTTFFRRRSPLPAYHEDQLLGRTLEFVSPRGISRGLCLKPVKLNGRCTVINNDPHTSQPDPLVLKTLAQYRTMPEPTTGQRGIMLGLNCLIETDRPEAYIRIGDEVRIH